MIEEVILKCLNETMNVPVVLEHPKKHEDQFVLFEKTGSSLSNQLCSSTFTFQSYAKSLYEASRLNEELKMKLLEINCKEIVSVYINSDYNFTDTETKRYRYQALVQIRHY